MNPIAWSLLLVLQLPPCISINPKLLEIESNQLSPVMKEFMTFIIHENCHEKDGFLFIMINRIEPEFSDFAMQVLNKNGSVIILNFDVDKVSKPMLNPNHFKFVLTDPEGELSHAESSFRKVRVSRAKIVLILTKRPLGFFITYLLNSYWKIQCLNVIIAYESDGKIEVITMNPYLPRDKYVNLTATKYTEDLFKDKALDLHNYVIRALLTHPDRTKIKQIGPNQYDGKDFKAINTVVQHLNGKFEIVRLENLEVNPWFQSKKIANRSEIKREILQEREIALLVNSGSFTTNDGIVENLYPHTQNDLVALVPKSESISSLTTVLSSFSLKVWLVYTLTPIAIMLGIKKLFRSLSTYQDLVFETVRLHITNNTLRFRGTSIEQILFLAWLIYGFLMNMVLQTKTTSTFTIRSYQPEIDTIDHLVKSHLRLLAIPNQIEEIKKKYAGTPYEKFAESLIPLELNEGQLDQIVHGNKINLTAFVIESDLAVFVARNRAYRREGVPIYHLVEESLIPSYQAFKVTHGSPLLPIINKMLRRLSEGGFIELWAKSNIQQATIEGKLDPEGYDESRRVIKPLTLELLSTAFQVLGLGAGTATLVFLTELWIFGKEPVEKIIFIN